MRGFFITGTDTGVGKTYIGALLARELRSRGKYIGVYKPAASGCPQLGEELYPEDGAVLWRAAGEPLTLDDVCPQRFAAPLSPDLAARVEGSQVDRHLLRQGLKLWNSFEIVLVEGAGGLMSPISDQDLNVDLARDFGFPLLIVTSNRLGCIHQVLQTLVVAEHFRIPVHAVCLNTVREDRGDRSQESNARELRRWAPQVPIWGPLPQQVQHLESSWITTII